MLQFVLDQNEFVVDQERGVILEIEHFSVLFLQASVRGQMQEQLTGLTHHLFVVIFSQTEQFLIDLGAAMETHPHHYIIAVADVERFVVESHVVPVAEVDETFDELLLIVLFIGVGGNAFEVVVQKVNDSQNPVVIFIEVLKHLPDSPVVAHHVGSRSLPQVVDCLDLAHFPLEGESLEHLL